MALPEIYRVISGPRNPFRLQYLHAIIELLDFVVPSETMKPPISKADWTDLVWRIVSEYPECAENGHIPSSLFVDLMMFLEHSPVTDRICEFLLRY